MKVFNRFILLSSLSLVFLISGYNTSFAQDHDHDPKLESYDEEATGQHDNGQNSHQSASHDDCGHGEVAFNAGATALHHISDANIYSIGNLSIPLPCILYAKGQGLDFFSSSKFDPGHHGTGHIAYNRYVLHEGGVKHIDDSSFPMGEVHIDGIYYDHVMEGDKEVAQAKVCYSGKKFKANKKSSWDAGMLGGGITSFYDFSITKNVVTLFLIAIILGWIFLSIAKSYRTREGKAPKGIQSFMEPIFGFIQDEVAKPIIGKKWPKYMPYLAAIFFFILGLNLFGQIPFLGGSNVTGNLAVTAALAIFTFFIVNLSGNKDYWKHIFWMPGIPAWVKLIITPVEIIGLFLKPITLTLRLFANITAGHIVIISFVSLIFILGNAGESVPGSVGGMALSIPLTLFMFAIELLVAFLQAFIFTILSAVYIGAAIEEHH